MQVLQDKYQLLAPIASGGMATVYMGRVIGVGGFERIVAIKRMHPHLLREAGYVEMFLDEARLAARIRHPNVVATLDVAESDEGPFIVMEFIEGPSLSQLFKALRKRRELVPIPVLLRIFDDVLGGLHAAHELSGRDKQSLNLVHRDVSPQNIMVGHDGVARITDFGVARARVRLSSTRSGELKGKLAYLPPEQARGDEIDRRADVYSAGVVLWEALTGKRLFAGKSEMHVMHQLIEGAKQSPREINPDVPPAIDEACMRALAYEAEGRFATAAEFARALEQAAADAGVTVASARTVAELAQMIEVQLPSTSEPPPSQSSMSSVGRAEAESNATTAGLTASAAAPPSRRGGLVLGGLLLFAAGAGVAVLLSSQAATDSPSGEPDAAVQAAAPSASSPPEASSSPSASSAVPIVVASAASSAPPAGSVPSASATASATVRSPPAPVGRPQPIKPAPVQPTQPKIPNADYQPEKL